MLELGKVFFTPGALLTIPLGFSYSALQRHASGDWGDVSKDDWKENDFAVKNGERVISSYHAPSGKKFWIITEWDRSYTTVLLPEEY